MTYAKQCIYYIFFDSVRLCIHINSYKEKRIHITQKIMPITFLDNHNQLSQPKPIQLGSSSEPCIVLFGLNGIDAKKPWRNIKITPTDTDLAILLEFDMENVDNADIVRFHEGVPYISVKVHEKFTKSFNDNKILTDLDTASDREQLVLVVIRPRKWKMNGLQGVSFRAAMLVVVGENLDITDVL